MDIKCLEQCLVQWMVMLNIMRQINKFVCKYEEWLEEIKWKKCGLRYPHRLCQKPYY